jgi:heme oxygenase
MIAAGSMRSRLRAATAGAHERMHAHRGFAAAAAGAISIADYRWLLRRLHGFHRAFEIALAERVGAEFVGARARAHLIAADLEALGLDAGEIARLPLCDALSTPRDKAEALGALYVVEGSTLGGVQIARALQGVVGGSDGRGRLFYLGYGERHGAMWRAFLEELEALAERRADADAAVRAAVDTFEQFERWMRDWRYASPAVAALDLTP